MRRRTSLSSSGLILALAVVGCFGSATISLGQGVITAQQATQDVSVREVSSDGKFVSGVLVNNTANTVRDVRLEIRHVWLWTDERNPGAESPGRTDSFTVPGDIAAGGNERFTYQIQPPLPVRTDGSFTTNVGVVGYSEVGK